MGWQDAPVVDNAQGSPAWASAPIVNDDRAPRGSTVNVQLPDGTTVQGVPEGTTKAQLAQKLRANGRDVPAEWLAPPKTTFSFEEASRPATFSFEDASTPKDGGLWEQKAPNYGDIDPITGAAQGAASVLSGAVAAPVAGLSGMAAAFAKVLGISDAEAGDVVRKVQEHLTYQPPSKTGQAVAGAVSAPFEWLANRADTAGQKVSDATGSPLLGAAVNTGIQAIPMIVGKVAGKVGGKLSAMEDTAAAARGKLAIDQAPTRDGIKAATDAGYTLTPSAVKGGTVSTSVEGLAGSAKLQKAASVKNQAVTNDLVRKDIGLDADTPATPKAIQAIIDDAHKPYEAIKKVGAFDNDPQYVADIDKTTATQNTAASVYEHRQKLTPDEQRFQDTVDGLKKADTTTTDAAVDEVKLLRANAAKAFRDGDTTLGYQYRALAEAVDGAMDRALQKVGTTGDMSGDPAVVNAVGDYQAARTKIAKAYQAQDALGVDGNFDASVYGAIAKKNPGLLSGPALQVGQFARQFPKLAQQAQKIGATGPDIGDLALMAFRAAKGAAGDALALGARPAARAALLSTPVQRAITRPPSYARPMSSRAAQLLADVQSSPAIGAGEMASGQSQESRLQYIKSLAGQP